jgi:lipopolysaccharide export system protein LptC
VKGTNRLTTTYPADVVRRGSFQATARRDTNTIFRAARRHSRGVRLLRIGVPVGIFGVLLAVVLANYLPTGGLRLPGEIAKLVIKGSKITMQQPRLNGYTNDGRPYEFTAVAAAQDITKPDLMELQQLYGKMETQDKHTVELSARSGIYNLKTEILKLNDDIVLTSSTGYEGRLIEAVVDVRKGHVMSDKPVAVKLLNGVLNAKGLEVLEKGDVIRFQGGVSMTLHPGDRTSDGEPDSPAVASEP